MRVFLFIVLALSVFGCVEERYGVPDKTSRFRQICIGGHVYWQSSSGEIAIDLDDEGTPIKCGRQ